jgi:hypothetical protein
MLALKGMTMRDRLTEKVWVLEIFDIRESNEDSGTGSVSLSIYGPFLKPVLKLLTRIPWP